MNTNVEKLHKRARSSLLRVEIHQYVLSKSNNFEKAIEQWMRNGVWGTCCDCPELKIAGKAVTLPEHCENFGRHDHQLAVSDSFRGYRGAMKLFQQQIQEALSVQGAQDSPTEGMEHGMLNSKIKRWSEKYRLSYQEVQNVIGSLELVNALN